MLSINNNVEDKTNGKIRVSTICLRNDAETNISMALVAFSIIILSVYLLRHILKININHKKLPITLSMRKKNSNFMFDVSLRLLILITVVLFYISFGEKT